MIQLVRDLPVYYEERGEGKPVLCIHGYSLDHRMMMGCMEPIFEQMKGYRRIYLDMPGMGKTPSANRIKNNDDMLEVISEFIDAVIPGENFLVAGESHGGYMTLGLIKNMPDRINGVLMICPMVKSWVLNRVEKEKLPKKQTLWVDKDMPSEETPDVKNFMDYAVIATPETLNRYKSEILSGISISDSEFLFNYFDGAYSHDFEAELRTMEFNKPSCIITGRQDHAVGYLDAFAMLNRFPRTTFAALDCAGHNLQIENEPIFSTMVKDWIWRVEMNAKEN